MDANAPGMWLLPTRGRVHTNLPRFLRAAIATGISTPGVLILHSDDYAENRDAYDALTLPENWSLMVTDIDGALASTEWARVELTKQHFGAAWWGWLADDAIPETEGWDTRLIAHLRGWDFVTCDDRMEAPARMGTCYLFSAALVDAVGWLCLPGAHHMFSDAAWEPLGRHTKCWTCDLDIVVRHNHA